MTGDLISFTLLSLSPVLIIVNPLDATLVYVSLTQSMEQGARDACRSALIIRLIVAIAGTWILQLFDGKIRIPRY